MGQIQSLNRQEMRQSIGRNMGIVLIGEATSTVDTTSLIDTKWLARGGDDEHNGKQVVIFDAAGSIVDGETSFVSDFVASSYDATCTPAFTANIADGDKYEMWQSPWVKEDIDDIINQCITSVSRECLQFKCDVSTYSALNQLRYSLSGFAGVCSVEYEAGNEIFVDVDDGETAWTAGSNVTVAVDNDFYRYGSGCNKFTISAAATTTQILAYHDIAEVDLALMDTLEFDMYCSVAATAGVFKFIMDDTVGCASTTEAISIPAMAASTWYRHSVTLANPSSDSAIVSVGIYQQTDVGACTMYVGHITACKNTGRQYKTLSPEQWHIVKGSTTYLELTASGKSVVGDDTLLRVTGYELPALLAAETTDSQIDPAWIIAEASARGLLGHAKSSSIDIHGRKELGDRWKLEANTRRPSIRTQILPNTRWC